jgi:phospholipid/cholesterol/gamma-HCH transport system ATP-binding protein
MSIVTANQPAAIGPAAGGGANDAIVDIQDLHFSYGKRPIFKGISLKVPRGKVVAILGSSGSGKSTLLKLIGGQLAPSSGSVKVNGEVVHELDTQALYRLRRRMGMMFQVSGLFSDSSVFDNIAFPLRELTDLPEEIIKPLVLMKLQTVGLRGAHRLMPSELSGGMARRVALARAIVMDPMLAMYDEPFAGLDPISLGLIASLIRELNDALGSTSIVVSYDVSESIKLVDYVYVLDEGKVKGEGTTAELMKSDDPYIHQFLHQLPDGPVRFNYPAVPLETDLKMPAPELDRDTAAAEARC